MDDGYVFPAQSKETKKVSFHSGNILKGFLAFAILLSVAGISYFLGTKNTTKKETLPLEKVDQNIEIAFSSPTPTQEHSGTPTPVLSKNSTQKHPFLPTSTPTPSPFPKTKILASVDTLDGFQSSTGYGSARLEIRVGRNANLVTRGFVSFDLSSIPEGAKISKATLRLYQVKVFGNPYKAGGSLKVDHLTYGDSLDDSDYGMAALSASFVTLNTNPGMGWKEGDVTDRVRDDLSNARSRSQFRIHFNTETTGGDSTGDFVFFEAAENSMGTGNTPQLVVNYY